MNTTQLVFLMRPNISLCALRKNLRPQTWSRAIYVTASSSSAPNPDVAKEEDYWTKNKRLNRPVSPHLTIYKPQVTSMLSITHRGTGVYLALAISGFSIGMLALPGSFPHYLSVVEAMHFGPLLIYLAKFGLAFPFMFHVSNGVRHLAWDLGYGFSLRALYRSGYFVLGSSMILAAILAAL